MGVQNPLVHLVGGYKGIEGLKDCGTVRDKVPIEVYEPDEFPQLPLCVGEGK